MPTTDLEQAVVQEVAARRDDLVALLGEMIAWDTTARVGSGTAHDERALQEHLAARLRAAGASAQVWEPTAADVPPSRQVPEGLDWTGYAQLSAVLPGRGGGRSLLLNGHVDVVSADPRERWTSDPFRAQVRDGRLYGRGACDMKGGLASLVVAAEVLGSLRVPLRGDLLVSAVTDEESTSAGGVAAVARGVRADAVLVAEPTDLRVAVACRGTLMPSVVLRGQAGHAAAVQPHWRAGGAVSAAEKASFVIDAVRRLRESWREEPALAHDLLPPPSVVVTRVNGGQWPVSYADVCRVDCHVSYLPSQADAEGYGSRVEEEFRSWVLTSSQVDPWLAAFPPQITWSVDVPPAEAPRDHPLVASLTGALSDAGLPPTVTGADFWHDGATWARATGVPAVVFGPGDVRLAHAVDESVVVDDLVRAAQTIAVAALRFCGTDD